MRVAVDLTVIRRLASGVERVALAAFGAVAALPSDLEWLTFIRPEAAGLIRGIETHVELIELNTPAARVLWQQWRLPALLRQYGVDLLISPAYTAPLRCRCPVLLWVHDLIALERPDLCARRNRLHFRALVGASVRHASRVIVPSRTVAEAVSVRLRPRIQPVVIAHGIGPRFHADHSPAEMAATRRTLALPDRFLLAVGRLERKKNLSSLIQALPQLGHPVAKDLGLVVVGTTGHDARPILRMMEESPAHERIRHFSHLSEAELARLYGLADCLVFPSLAEGFGIPPLECLASGTQPLVSHFTPSYVERWGFDRWVLPGLTPGEVAGAIDGLLDAPPNREALAAKRREVQDLTWKRHAELLLELINDPGEPLPVSRRFPGRS